MHAPLSELLQLSKTKIIFGFQQVCTLYNHYIYQNLFLTVTHKTYMASNVLSDTSDIKNNSLLTHKTEAYTYNYTNK